MSAGTGSLGNVVKADADPDRPLPLGWQSYSDLVLGQWFALLSRNPEENKVQDFLELHPSLIPGGSGDIGPGGHHGSDLNLVFRQPVLKGVGRDFKPDFMWITRSSSLITPILIEIEKPSKRWFRQDGRPTQHFTEAHDQLRQWRQWFRTDGNSTIFRDKYLFLNEKYDARSLEPQFVLIYGRSSEFELGGGHQNPDDLNRKRSLLRGPDETFLTFDSLRPRYDHHNAVTATMRATGPEAFAFSPVYEAGPRLLNGILRLNGAMDALDRSVMMTDERRNYLKGRWAHWSEQSAEQARSGRPWVRELGFE